MGKQMKMRWRARQIPELRRDLVRSLTGNNEHLQRLLERAVRGGFLQYGAEFVEGLKQGEERLAALRAPMMVWVSSDMAALALDAATDCPGIVATDAPARTGLVLVEEPLPALDVASFGGLYLRSRERTDIHYTDPVVVDGLIWAIHDEQELAIMPLCRAHRLPHPLFPTPGELVPLATIRVPLPGILGDLGAQTVDGHPVDPGQAHGLTAWLSSMWVMSRQPSTTHTKRIDARTGETGLARIPHDADVTIINIRPTPHRSHDTTPEGSGRKLRTRHLVRGHWTNQPHGPGRSQRRLQWIDSYVRGPEDAPLIERERVWAWRTH
ncbi:MAG: hypothetical protein Q4D96_09140 [Propionibacteriaceae bacterium]|nr:hypothetical protein [Propionibacteriaceae bacterium]